jgi:PAS domain-containing protein
MARDQFVIGASFISDAPGDAAAGAAQTVLLSSASVTRIAAHTAARGVGGGTPSGANELAERVRWAAAHSPTATALVALDHRIVWMNDAFPRLLGMPASAAMELVGLPFEPAVKPAASADNRPLLQVGRLRATYGRRDASEMAVYQTVSTLRDSGGTAVFLLAVAEAVESEETQRVRRKTAARLQERAAAHATAATAAENAAAAARAVQDAEIDRIRRAMFS